jgi:hypothetical protein
MFPVEVQIGTKSKESVPWLPPPYNFHFRPVLQDRPWTNQMKPQTVTNQILSKHEDHVRQVQCTPEIMLSICVGRS